MNVKGTKESSIRILNQHLGASQPFNSTFYLKKDVQMSFPFNFGCLFHPIHLNPRYICRSKSRALIIVYV